MWREGDEREQALRTVPGDPYLLLVPLPEVTSGINAVWGGAREGSRVQPGLSPGLASTWGWETHTGGVSRGGGSIPGGEMGDKQGLHHKRLREAGRAEAGMAVPALAGAGGGPPTRSSP